MIKLLITCVLLFSAVSTAIAALNGDAEVRFLAERVPGGLGKVVLADADGRSEPFDLPINNLSPPQTPPSRSFSVWSVEKDASMATVNLPEEGKSFVVLLLPAAKGGYSPVVMPFDNPSFKAGDFYFHNNTRKTVLGFVGTAKFVLKPRQGTVLKPTGARAEKFYDVGLGVREEEGDRVLSTTRWPEDKATRFYVFFYKDPKTNRITFRGVDEFVMPRQER